MAYNESLAGRLDKLVKRRKAFTQKKMFGGVGFLLNGNMCFGVYKDYLILRMDPESADAALKKKHTRQFDITGRAMTGWVMVELQALQDDGTLKAWIEQSVKFVNTLPPK